MHIERLTMLADMLDNLPPTHFNLSAWAYEVSSEGECGTVACAVGWACMMPAFQKQGLRLEWVGSGAAFPVFSGETSFEAVEKFFQLEMGEARWLFCEDNYDADNGNVQPSEVAARIRSLLMDEVAPCPGNAPMDHPVKKPPKPAKKPKKLEVA